MKSTNALKQPLELKSASLSKHPGSPPPFSALITGPDRAPQECMLQGEQIDKGRVQSEARVLRIVKVMRILKIIRILKAFKVIE